MDAELLKDKFIGCMLGTHAGDALGMPVEGFSHKAIEAEFGEVRDMIPARLGVGTYTDDTEMMISVAESLVEKRGFDGNDMARRFVENYNPSRGYGGGTYQALRLLRSGMRWDAVGERIFGGGSFGNGSAMRVAPVGVFCYDNPDELRRVAHQSSRITHSHILGREGAALQAYAVALAVGSDPKVKLDAEQFLHKLIQFVLPEAKELEIRLERMMDLMGGSAGREDVIRLLGHDSRIFSSVPTAIYAFLRHYESFEEAVVYAVGLGGDTDTIGAMAGAISGGRHGRSGIPWRWLSRLEDGQRGRSYIEELAERLWGVKLGR